MDELRPPAAGRLLNIRRAVCAENRDGLEQAALCNAQVLAESCFSRGEPAFAGTQEVLDELTFPEMERLLARLGGEGASWTGGAANAGFDPQRFTALRRGTAEKPEKPPAGGGER
ncbi:MAG: hypothetical protein LKJ80_02000 [Oscillibacter sp.]|nr:hypothetical protein [Oscillibacter sp.]